jgi:putative ATPase
MQALGYGRASRYAHDEPDAYAAGQHYFPEGMTERRYYRPVPRGLEIKIGEKLEWLRELDRQARGAGAPVRGDTPRQDELGAGG